MFAASVDASEWFLVKEADKAMFLSDLLHGLHDDVVVVGGNVGGKEYGGKLVLSWSNFVVLGLGKDAKLPKLFVEVIHEISDLGLDDAEVVVIKFLAFWGWSAKEGPAGEHKVFSLFVEIFVDKEVFLFRTSGGLDMVNVLVVEVLKDTHGLLV